MSSIPSNRRPHVPGAVKQNDENSLTKIAENNKLFQHNELSGSEGGEEQGSGSPKKSAQAGKHAKTAGKSAGANVGAAGAPGAAAGPTSLAGGPQPGNAETYGVVADPSLGDTSGNNVLPDPSSNASGAPASGAEVDEVAALATAQTAPVAVQEAVAQFKTDLADPKTTKAAFAQDIKQLGAALTQAGIETPIASVINDLIDPKGKGTAAPQELVQAAMDQQIDLSKDQTDKKQAVAALNKVVADDPTNSAAAELAAAHVVRTSGLDQSSAAEAFKSVADKYPASSNSNLAALIAAAAKNGVDLSQSNEDKIAGAQNNAAQRQQQQASKKSAQQSAQQAAAANWADSTGKVNYGGGQPYNTTQYASIPKTGPGASHGGWDTSGNEPIAPNQGNPINFERDYGIKGGFTSQSLDDLLAKVPQLTSQYPNIKEILTSAAASANPPIPPELLLSTLGVETSYATNHNNGQDGPFQFIASTFAAYGSGDRTNMQDAANAAANYYSTLLRDNDMNLFNAMRDYNGDINLGASNSYQKDQQSIFNGNMG